MRLGATSKEHHTYISSSKSTKHWLLGNAKCSGNGLIDQQRVFGYWQDGHIPEKYQCLAEDAKPCTVCGTMVCDVSNYHCQEDRRPNRADTT